MSTLDDFFADELQETGKAQRPRRRRKTPKKDLEAGVVRECLIWLNLQGYYCERRNTGAIKTADSYIRFGSPGAADIFAVIDGRHYEVEVKRRDGKGRLSPSQKAFQREMKEYGIPYLVVTSAGDLEKQIGSWRLHRTI